MTLLQRSLKDLLALINALPACSVSHIQRDLNQAADWLSKYAMSGAFFLALGDQLPSPLVQILQHDKFQNAHLIL